VRIRIRHVTSYRYDRGVDYTAQLARLTPQDHVGQRVLTWRVTEIGGRALPRIDDGYGNIVHMLSIRRRHDEAALVAEGEVETSDTHGIVRGAVERLPPPYFLRRTPPTEPDAGIAAFAAEFRPVADPVERLHRLMNGLHARVVYDLAATSASTTAAEAFERGRGVCQDHSQIFIAAARLLGYPARYVSGYFRHEGQSGPSEAAHAWAEAYVDPLGWVGFDAANDICPTDAYVRVAIGLDRIEAAPVRGVRRGVAEESLSVSVDVRQAVSQQ
jgi:transglutaminase-like putative cysteine protease